MKNVALGLRTVVYYVPDLEKAKEWYARVFKLEPYYDTPYYVGFNVGGYELGLHPSNGEYKPNSGNLETYWGVEDIEEAMKWFIECGATEHKKPQNVGGEIVLGSVKDPWGHVIGLIYNPHFSLPE